MRRADIHCIADQVCSRSRQRASGLMHDAPGCNPGSTPTCSLVTSPKAGRWQKAGAGRLWCANKEGAPELAGFMARVRSTLRELTVAHCLTTTNEVSGGSLGDGP